MKYFKKIVSLTILLMIILYTTAFAATDEISTYSPTVLLMESKTGKVIFEKNAHEKMYPASTTKIMTAILTLENCELTDKATASYEAIYTVPVGYSNANIQVGEELTVNQLLNVLMVGSANEAANILAEHIAGSVSSFATMMNSKASELGCENTHFVNANGVHNTDHYTTAYDLALMGRYAMQNETFRKLVSTTFYTLPATNKYDKNDRVFGNTNELIKKDDSDRVDNYYYKYCNGIKTGFTNAAKNCIVASAQKDGIEYIVVIMGAESTENGLSARYIDCKNLFNYAFENYTVKTLYEKNSVLKSVKVSGASLTTRNLNALVENEISVVVRNNTDVSNINPTVEINPELKAPISANTVIGKVTYNIDGHEYSSNLLAANDVVESNFLSVLLTFVAIVLILYLLYRFYKTKGRGKKKKKKTSYKSDRSYLYW